MAADAPQGTEKILFVDDELIARRLAEQALSQLGYPFTTVANGNEALAACERDSFALVFVDLKLPGISGQELLRRVKEKSPTTDCIVLTAYPSLRSAIQTFKDGAYDYLLKPIEVTDLQRTVERWGGSIGCEPGTVRGSRFWFRLPRAGAPEPG